MKLYDVIRKEDIARGKPLPEIEPEEQTHRKSPRQPLSVRKYITIGVSILFIVLLYVGGMKVVRAKVVVNERHIPFSLDGEEFELIHESDAGAGRLSFQTMVVPTEVTRQVYGSQVEPSTSSAKGKVVFFNMYSTTTKTIKAKTTLTGANGKKYQTQAQVSVPGYTISAKKKVPGASVAVGITAIEAGPSYNTNGTTFTVAGWNAKVMYAQSAGAITGGEQGITHSVSEAEKPEVIDNLKTQLIERLKRETNAQIPENLIAYKDLQFTTIDSDSIKLRGTTMKFPASISGTMVTYLIPRDLLEAAIARKVLREHTYANVTIPGLADLVVEPVVALSADPKSVPESIKVKVSGSGTIITKAPVETIRQSVIGIRKHAFNESLTSIPEIDTAMYRLYPFWAPLFPTNQNRITIEVK